MSGLGLLFPIAAWLIVMVFVIAFFVRIIPVIKKIAEILNKIGKPDDDEPT